MGDFNWSIDLIKKLIAKGIWFGASEPPRMDKVPSKLSRKDVPHYAYVHRNDKFNYLFHAPVSKDFKGVEITMPYCPCNKGKRKKELENIMSNLEPNEKGKLLELQNNWCSPCSN